jgi:hypothetical protein
MMDCEGFLLKPILPFLPKARMNSAGRAGRRQVFGLAGWKLSYWPLLPGSRCEPVR